ncbi:MAG: hypothetical protein O7D32_07925 [bacterium]|nr:hypothetical protein [bacterium]
MLRKAKWKSLFVLTGTVACSFCHVAMADVILDKRYPVQDEQTRIHVTDSSGAPVTGADVMVTYRPGSSVSREDSVGQSGMDGALAWTPQQAGIATITATWQEENETDITSSATVSVKFASPPFGGILIMTVAGLLLIVGSVVRITKLIRSPEVH